MGTALQGGNDAQAKGGASKGTHFPGQKQQGSLGSSGTWESPLSSVGTSTLGLLPSAQTGRDTGTSIHENESQAVPGAKCLSQATLSGV